MKSESGQRARKNAVVITKSFTKSWGKWLARLPVFGTCTVCGVSRLRDQRNKGAAIQEKRINGKDEKNTFSGESANREFFEDMVPKESGHSRGPSMQDARLLSDID